MYPAVISVLFASAFSCLGNKPPISSCCVMIYKLISFLLDRDHAADYWRANN